MGFIVRRIVTAVPVVVAVSFIVFGMIFLVGDPAVLMMPPEATAEDIAAFRHAYGFDDPFHVQYTRFLGKAVQGDLGLSIRYRQSALELVWERLPATLQLSGFSMLFATLIALPLGILSALRRNSWIDYVASIFAVIGQSMPNYWLGFLAVYFISVKLRWLPTSGGPGLEFVILPAMTIAVAVTALITRMVRSTMLEVLNEDYIRTARAKGLKERAVIVRHALRNALLPVITIIALQFGHILGGAVVVETVYQWPGLGLLTINAIYGRDYPVVQAAVFFLAISFVLINLIVDISYQFLDPRLRQGAR